MWAVFILYDERPLHASRWEEELYVCPMSDACMSPGRRVVCKSHERRLHVAGKRSCMYVP